MKRRRIPSKWLLAGFAGIIYALIYLPIALVVLTSFNESTITTLPIEQFSLKWYLALFENPPASPHS
jgi:spermidine/putrescine transport system permease protein